MTCFYDQRERGVDIMSGTAQKEDVRMFWVRQADNERGSVLVISMLILVMLTLLGFASMGTSNVEIMVAGNERTYKENFFRAEAANMAGGQRYVNLADMPSDSMDFGSSGAGVSPESKWELMGGADWVSGMSVPSQPFSVAVSGAAIDNNSRYHVVYEGAPVGSSEGLEASASLRQYSVCGQSDIKGGNVIIQTGGSVRF
jgi:hypothetical protein